jgi:chain length determinant protein (polysaccharide antigen chain regulator)
MRGSKALIAEIKNLQERQTDDPFIANLRALQIKRSLFQALQVNPENVSVYRRDGPIEVPDRPLKPKKAMIIIGGFVGGGIVGVLICLIRLFVSKRRKAANVS